MLLITMDARRRLHIRAAWLAAVIFIRDEFHKAQDRPSGRAWSLTMQQVKGGRHGVMMCHGVSWRHECFGEKNLDTHALKTIKKERLYS